MNLKKPLMRSCVFPAQAGTQQKVIFREADKMGRLRRISMNGQTKMPPRFAGSFSIGWMAVPRNFGLWPRFPACAGMTG